MTHSEPLPEDLAEAFSYLDGMRASGVTNMCGAGPYLMGLFGYPRSIARVVLSAWMKTFDGETSAATRAAAALAAEEKTVGNIP